MIPRIKSHLDVKSFCNLFNEGLRVEYKRNLDSSVRQKIPEIVASFANSRGGTLLIGVVTKQGVPQEPIDGFELPTREELGLTIQQLCFDHIYPELSPSVNIIPAEIPGKGFVEIIVDESLRAPHAVENSTKVYVRTGEATKPYDFADIPLIERLTDRRKASGEIWESFRHEAITLLRTTQSLKDWPYLQVSLGPVYPLGAVTTRSHVFDFFHKDFRNAQIFVQPSMKRHNSGVYVLEGSDLTPRFLYADVHGCLFLHLPLEDPSPIPASPSVQQGTRVFQLWETVHDLGRYLKFASGFLGMCNFEGQVTVAMNLINTAGKSFNISVPGSVGRGPTTTHIHSINAESQPAVSELTSSGVLGDLFHQMLWPLGDQPIAKDRINDMVAKFLG